ncbi:unnamed protein product, partial [Adineta steineri]
GTWVNEFREHLTNKHADFHEANGKISKVKLMHKRDTYAYAKNKDLGVQIVHLPYESDSRDVQFVFTVILPKQGVSLSDVEKKLISKPALMQDVLNPQSTTEQKLLLYLPKFKMEATLTLNDVLKQLGIQDAFDPGNADFTGIASKQDDVNGSEAAAATDWFSGFTGGMIGQNPDPIIFKADRPFLFYIREIKQNLTLFTGKFVTCTNTSS